MYFYALHVVGVKGGFFTYCSSSKIEKAVWVKVKFRNRLAIALVIEEQDPSLKLDFKPLEILEVLDTSYKVPETMLKLLLWLSEYYVEDFDNVLPLFMTAKLLMKKAIDIVFKDEPLTLLDPEEKKVVEYMKKKRRVTEATLIKKFEKGIIENLLKQNCLCKVTREKLIKNEYKKTGIAEELAANSSNSNDANFKFLTEEQEKAKLAIENSNNRFFLIHGITGSGKTELYIELIRNALKSNGSVIYLVPEISLTTQFIQRLKDEFKEDLALLHSKIKPAEKRAAWLAIYEGEKRLVVGVRSAIFAPVNNLKYIIIDEEHESSYKQDNSPRYNAVYVAMKRVQLENAKLVLGSATPSITSYHYAKTGLFELLTLSERYKSVLPIMNVVNMCKEHDKAFSKSLIIAITDKLLKKEQVLILINRKGYANFVQCVDCGAVEKCKYCSLSLVYYSKEQKLKCHYCGYEKPFIKKCNCCGLPNLKMYGLGIEKVEERLKEALLIPAKILKVDSESVKNEVEAERVYREFSEHKYDIMIGTKMIAKGLHFPNVTLVCILDADSLLYFPDFMAAEKTFQLITQAAGRAGRELLKGEVITQTYLPEHYVIERAKESDYLAFYNEELKFRKELFYPPFSKVINIIVSAPEEKLAESEAMSLYSQLKAIGLKNIFGPMKAPIFKISDRFRFQIFIKGTKEEIFLLKKSLKKILQSKRPKNVKISVDVDPINLM